MRADRLLQLADYLETLPPNRFDFRMWVGDSWMGAQDLSCGTTACAMGWGVVLFGKECGVELRSIGNSYVPAPIGVDIRYADAYSRASELIFDLSQYSTDYLFTPCDQHDLECHGSHCDEEGAQLHHCEDTGRPLAKATAIEVAAHIRRFVAEHTS